MQQAFLRWNQGQELRQALITIAVSVIVADQIIAHFPRNVGEGTQKFGGNAVDLTWPGWTDRFVNLHIGGVEYSLAKLVLLGIGVAVGVGLWLWLYRTKTGMVIRAGVDDEQMTSALGINIQKTFAIAFVVGSALAALGAVVWASQSNISSGQDGQWLLNSLVVVIVGGMGSIFGAAAGAILFAFVANFGAVVPADDRLELLHAVLLDPHVRPDRARPRASGRAGLFGKGGMNPKTWTRRQQIERGDRRGALVLVLVWPAAGFSTTGPHDPDRDVHLRDRRGEPDLPLGLRRHGLARADRALRDRRRSSSGTWRRGRPGRDVEGAPPRLGPDASRWCSRSSLTTVIGLIGGAVAVPERRHLLPDDHAHLLGDRAPTRSAR